MVTTLAPNQRINPLDSIGTAANLGDSSKSALRRGNLDFDVKVVPLRNPVTGEPVRDGDKDKFFATIRTDTNEMLGVVERRYTVCQNGDLFDIADAMVEEDGAIIKRVSSIESGARCFMKLEWPRERSIRVVGDVVSRQAIIQNAHNGKHSALVRLMPLRLACINGMVLPVPEMTYEFRIKHTQSLPDRLQEARRIMSAAGRYFETFGEVATRMAQTKVSIAHAKRLFESLIPGDTTASNKKRDELFDLFDGGQAEASHRAIKGTAWGWLQAVGEQADHSGRVRKSLGNNTSVQRFKSVLEGSSSKIKLNAWETLLADPDLGIGAFYEDLSAAMKNASNN